jgi:outer membrane protein assembly factor BamB
MTIDRTLLINAPAGRLTSLDLDTGETRWARDLADPVADDVPRRLEPVLRSGALFVPAATVHILRPTDGTSLGTALPCDLVPDLLRVDERGWVYVAEESGHLAAHSPVTQLTLV